MRYHFVIDTNVSLSVQLDFMLIFLLNYYFFVKLEIWNDQQ